MATFDHETIIVGAGAAGMNCALDLKAAGHDYLLIADYMGGRIYNNTERHMNYGAVFYFGSYRTMLSKERGILKPTVDVVPSLSAAACNRGDKQWGAVSGKTAGHFSFLIRYMRYMRNEFLPNYERFKKDCEVMEVSRALANNRFIDQLFHETADEWMDRINVRPICEDLVSMFAHACTGTPPEKLTALDYLNTVQPLTMELPSMKLVMELKRFDFDADGMTQRLSEGSGNVLLDNLVVKVEREGEGWKVTTDKGVVKTAKNLVMAMPVDVTADLLAPVEGVPDIFVRKHCVLYAYLLDDAVIKPHYAKHTVHIFDEQTPIIFIAKRGEREYEIFTEVDFEKDGRLDEYFDQYTIHSSKAWPKAMFTGPTEGTPQNVAPGLILAGDANGLGMEPAAISGVYAANKILGKTID